MDDSIPSISSGAVGSRFVSQTEIDTAKARRDEQWKAAYARLGQEPPPQPVEDVFDGRSLAEKLAANRAAKQEEWEERTKLANQFRALEEDEVQFLDSIVMEQQRKELVREQEDAAEVKGFKQAIAARNAISSTPPGQPSTSPPSTTPAPKPKRTPSNVPAKKSGKVMLKGVVMKKKKPNIQTSGAKDDSSSKNTTKDQLSDEEGRNKRRRVSSSERPDSK